MIVPLHAVTVLSSLLLISISDAQSSLLSDSPFLSLCTRGCLLSLRLFNYVSKASVQLVLRGLIANTSLVYLTKLKRKGQGG